MGQINVYIPALLSKNIKWDNIFIYKSLQTIIGIDIKIPDANISQEIIFIENLTNKYGEILWKIFVKSDYKNDVNFTHELRYNFLENPYDVSILIYLNSLGFQSTSSKKNIKASSHYGSVGYKDKIAFLKIDMQCDSNNRCIFSFPLKPYLIISKNEMKKIEYPEGIVFKHDFIEG